MRTSVKPTLFFCCKNESGFPIAEKTKKVRFPLPAWKIEEKPPKFAW